MAMVEMYVTLTQNMETYPTRHSVHTVSNMTLTDTLNPDNMFEG
jgi:hypothetical protein